jgi:hypothetical protein
MRSGKPRRTHEVSERRHDPRKYVIILVHYNETGVPGANSRARGLYAGIEL